MSTDDAASTTNWSRMVVCVACAILVVVNLSLGWLGAFWAWSQAAAVFHAGHPVAGWVLSLRPAALPIGMAIAWGRYRTTANGWSRGMRVLGVGAAIGFALLLLDGIASGGF